MRSIDEAAEFTLYLVTHLEVVFRTCLPLFSQDELDSERDLITIRLHSVKYCVVR